MTPRKPFKFPRKMIHSGNSKHETLRSRRMTNRSARPRGDSGPNRVSVTQEIVWLRQRFTSDWFWPVSRFYPSVLRPVPPKSRFSLLGDTKKIARKSGLKTIFLEENSGDSAIMLSRLICVQLPFPISDMAFVNIFTLPRSSPRYCRAWRSNTGTLHAPWRPPPPLPLRPCRGCSPEGAPPGRSRRCRSGRCRPGR